MNRRDFLHSTIALAAISKTMVAANDKVSVAIIGVTGETDLRGLAVPAMTDFIYTTRAGRPCHGPDANLTEL